MRRSLLLIICILLMPSASHARFDVQEVPLRHGMSVWLLEQSHLPLVSLRISIGFAGTAYDPQGKEGLAALVSQLLSRGPADMEHQAFHQWMERHGIKLDIGADREKLSIHLQSLTQHAPDALEMLGRILDQDRFSPSAVQTVKAETSARLARLASRPWFKASRAFSDQVYGDHPYGAFSLGTEQSINAITPMDIARYMQSLYQPQHWTMSLVGDMKADFFKEQSDALFGRWADVVSQPYVVSYPPMHRLSAAPQTHHVDIASDKAIVMMAWPAPARKSDQFLGVYLLNHMLGGGGLTSKLMLELRDARGLIYSGGSELDLWPSSNLWTIQYSTRPARVKESIDATRSLIEQFAAGSLDRDIWERSKAEVIGSFPLHTDSMGKLSYYLQIMQQYDLGTNYLNERNQLIDQWSYDDAIALAKQWLKDAPHTIIYATNQESQQ